MGFFDFTIPYFPLPVPQLLIHLQNMITENGLRDSKLKWRVERECS